MADHSCQNEKDWGIVVKKTTGKTPEIIIIIIFTSTSNKILGEARVLHGHQGII